MSNIFYFHPYLGNWSNLTYIFQGGWNHQLENVSIYARCWKYSFYLKSAQRPFQRFARANQQISISKWICLTNEFSPMQRAKSKWILRVLVHHLTKTFKYLKWRVSWTWNSRLFFFRVRGNPYISLPDLARVILECDKFVEENTGHIYIYIYYIYICIDLFDRYGRTCNGNH